MGLFSLVLGIVIGYRKYSSIRKTRERNGTDTATKDYPSDWQNDEPYFWIVVPMGTIYAAKAIYGIETIHSRWLWFLCKDDVLKIAGCIADIIFGFSSAITVLWIFKKSGKTPIRKSISSKASQFINKISGLCPKSSLPLPGTAFIVSPKDEYEKAVKALERHPNSKIDQNSAAFWLKRLNDTGGPGLNYRIYLDKKDIREALLPTPFASLEDLSIEFWKNKGGDFEIRHTKDDTGEFKKFKDATDNEKDALREFVTGWYNHLDYRRVFFSRSCLIRFALVLLGYLVAGGLGACAVWFKNLGIPLDVQTASSGMFAFGDSFLFLIVAGTVSLVPTLIWFSGIRPESRFWKISSIASLILSISGLLMVVSLAFPAGDRGSPLASCQMWAVLRALSAPLWILLFFPGVLLSSAGDRKRFSIASICELASGTIFMLHLFFGRR